MGGYGLRALVALIIAVFLWGRSRAEADRPRLRRVFELAAASLLAFAALNGSLAVGSGLGPLQIVMIVVGVALFVAAVVGLLQSLRGGELRSRRDRVASAAREFHARREERTSREDRS